VDPSREVSSSIALYPWLVVVLTPPMTAVLLVRVGSCGTSSSTASPPAQ